MKEEGTVVVVYCGQHFHVIRRREKHGLGLWGCRWFRMVITYLLLR